MTDKDENRPIFRQLFIGKPSKKTIAKVAGAVTFAALYSGYEYFALDNLGNNLKVDLGLGGTPITNNLYPYHLMIMAPVMAGTSLALAWDNKDPLRTYLNFFQVFPSLAVLEDISYFIIRGADYTNPDAGKYLPILTDWSANNYGGAIPIGNNMGIPIWYFIGAGLAGAAWALDNIVFREKKKKD